MSTAQPKPKPKPKGLDRPSTTRIIKVMSRINTRIYRATGGRIGNKWRIGAGFRKPVPICLLTTTGRKSGQPRSVMLTSPHQEGNALVVVASRGGDEVNPAWFLNLRDNPDVEVVLKGADSVPMRARIADADERARLWPLISGKYKNYAQYQTRTDREIPLVFLEPR
jgi:deazaflavin-dependent oxidoreductase (nitroreductase family)